MKVKRLFWPAAIVVMMAVAGSLVAPLELFTAVAQRPMGKHNALMSKVGKKWRVGTLTMKKDDEVTWSATDSDLYFQFMDSTLFGEYTYVVKKANSLTLKVKGTSGTHRYAIFRTEDLSYVEGNSPPTIIID
jgi:hypothetical protein